MHPDFSAAEIEKKCTNYASKYGMRSQFSDLSSYCLISHNLVHAMD
jgi:hypothetical protein